MFSLFQLTKVVSTPLYLQTVFQRMHSSCCSHHRRKRSSSDYDKLKKKPTKITLMQKRCCIWPQISEQMVSEEGSPTARRQGWRHGQESCCVLWLKTSSHPTVELYLAMSLNTFLVPCTSPFSPILLLTMYSWLKWAQIAPWPEGQAGRDCLGKNAWDPLGEAYVI